jgi:hypothetical protein
VCGQVQRIAERQRDVGIGMERVGWQRRCGVRGAAPTKVQCQKAGETSEGLGRLALSGPNHHQVFTRLREPGTV